MLRVCDVSIGDGAPLVLISGLNVLESEQGAIDCAQTLKTIAASRGLPLIFKASFDKANRSRFGAKRGVRIVEGLRILNRVKQVTGLPLLTDVHEAQQAAVAAQVVDFLQVPAFLSRQTDLIEACAATGLPMNIKKGQFMSATDMGRAVEKALGFGARGVLATERGSSFGYNDLVVDMRGLITLKKYAPVCIDATHASQYPGAGKDGSSSGDRSFVAPIARAAVASGVDAIFIEVHPDPANAPCDGACQLRFEELDELLSQLCAIDAALRRGQ